MVYEEETKKLDIIVDRGMFESLAKEIKMNDDGDIVETALSFLFSAVKHAKSGRMIWALDEQCFGERILCPQVEMVRLREKVKTKSIPRT